MLDTVLEAGGYSRKQKIVSAALKPIAEWIETGCQVMTSARKKTKAGGRDGWVVLF